MSKGFFICDSACGLFKCQWLLYNNIFQFLKHCDLFEYSAVFALTYVFFIVFI